MELLLRFDTYLFSLINHFPHSEFLDSIAQILSGIGNWGVIWVFLGIFLFFREERKDHRFILQLIFVVILSFIASELVLKPLVGRLRPTGDFFSFPSGHATMAFAAATLLVAKEPAWPTFLYMLASLVALSRVYLGVHYPLDVIAGSMLGFIIGRVGVQLGQFGRPQKRSTNGRQRSARKIVQRG